MIDYSQIIGIALYYRIHIQHKL